MSPPKASLLNSVMRFLIWATIFAAIGVPLVLFPLLREDKLTRQFEDPQRRQDRSAVVTNNGMQAKAAQIARLKTLTARPEMVSGAAAQLHIIAIAFEEAKPEPMGSSPANPRHMVDPDGYRRLVLDMHRGGKDAVVIIADQPIRWTIVEPQAQSWGRIGFEGLAPFDVAAGRPGMLAGFRIAAFGAQNTARVFYPGQAPGRLDSNLGPSQRQRAFCGAARTWTEHFGIRFDQAHFALVVEPTRIAPEGRSIDSDGQFRETLTGHAIEKLCERR